MTEPKFPFVLPTDEQRHEAFDAYAVAVGRVSVVWNHLHFRLGGLFAVIIGGDAELVLAAWDSVENDRTKREMLRAAINAASPERWKQTPKAPDDLLWVLRRANALSDVRNDAMHALVSIRLAETVEVTVALPARGERGKKLVDRAAKGRKLHDEFKKCERDADALSAFVLEATATLGMPERREWPTPRPKQIWSAPAPAKADKRAPR
jgi:hypothetical protein